MSKWYLVTLRPIDGFSFGGQRQFQYKNSKLTNGNQSNSHYNPYFISTSFLPEQTALFGVLRYHLLQQAGLVNHKFKYNEGARNEMNTLIGLNSFSLNGSNSNFGKIKEISPLFILKNNKEVIVKNPFNNKERDKAREFKPILLEESVTKTSKGNIHLPRKDEYVAKNGHGEGYYNLNQNCIESDIFIRTVRTYNSSNAGNGAEDSLFKRELYYLKKDYVFAFYAYLEESWEPSKSGGFVSMGQKSTIYQLGITEKDNNLENLVQKAFSKNTPKDMTWYYALSDCYVNKKLANDFAIIKEKSVKQLKTDFSRSNFFSAIQKQDKYHMLYCHGSVFYHEINKGALDCQKNVAGYNRLVKIQGAKK